MDRTPAMGDGVRRFGFKAAFSQRLFAMVFGNKGDSSLLMTPEAKAAKATAAYKEGVRRGSNG
jgi:hypothetical protein